MAENAPAIPKIFLFRLSDWSVQKEAILLEKLKSESLESFWNKYEVPNHPEIKGFYFVPDETEIVNKVKKIALTNTAFLLDAYGSYDPFNIPETTFGITKSGIPLMYIILGILILILIIGALK